MASTDFQALPSVGHTAYAAGLTEYDGKASKSADKWSFLRGSGASEKLLENKSAVELSLSPFCSAEAETLVT